MDISNSNAVFAAFPTQAARVAVFLLCKEGANPIKSKLAHGNAFRIARVDCSERGLDKAQIGHELKVGMAPVVSEDQVGSVVGPLKRNVGLCRQVHVGNGRLEAVKFEIQTIPNLFNIETDWKQMVSRIGRLQFGFKVRGTPAASTLVVKPRLLLAGLGAISRHLTSCAPMSCDFHAAF